MRKVMVAGTMLLGVVLVAGCQKKEEQPASQAPAGSAVAPSQGPAVAPSPGPADATRGALVFKDKCASCHAVNGAGGSMGPDLTKVGANRDADFLKKQIDDPKANNKDSKMPSFASLPQADKEALLAYLQSLK